MPLKIKLFGQKEDKWFVVPVKDRRGNDAEIDVIASTQGGANDLAKNSVKDYNCVVDGPARHIGTAQGCHDFD